MNQVGPRPTLILTISKVNISFLSEYELKLFDRSHRHVVLKQEEKVWEKIAEDIENFDK